MDAFAGYKVLRELQRDHLGRVLLVEQESGGDEKRAIRTCEPPEEMANRDRLIAAFLDRATAQKQIVAGGGQRWAPIHELQQTDDGAWFATDYYARTGEWLTQAARVAGPVLFNMTCSMLEGLHEAQSIANRPHGDLALPKLMLVNTRGELHLSDPLESQKAGQLTAADDLRRVGELIYRLIFNQTYTTVRGVPPADAPQWAELDPKRAQPWHDFVAKLLDPSLASSEPDIGQILDDFRKQVAPPSQTGKRVAIAVAAALLLAAPFSPLLLPECHPIRAAIPFYAPDPDLGQWEYLCDAHHQWAEQLFEDFETEFDDARRQQWVDAGLGPVINELDQVRASGVELSPRAISGKGSLYSVLRKQPPEAAGAICQTKQAVAALKRVDDGLDDWPPLASLRQKVRQYKAAGWTSLESHVQRIIHDASPQTGLDERPVKVAAGVETVVAITSESGAPLAKVDQSLERIASGMEQAPSPELRERFRQFANAYLQAADGQGGQFLASLESRLQQLTALLPQVSKLAGQMNEIEVRIRTAREEMRIESVASQYDDDYHEVLDDLLVTLRQAEADAQRFEQGLDQAAEALAMVERKHEVRFKEPPPSTDPRTTWRQFRDQQQQIPLIDEIADRIGAIGQKYQDQQSAQDFRSRLDALTQMAAETFEPQWTWENKFAIERDYSQTVSGLKDLETQVSHRLEFLARPIDTPKPTNTLVERIGNVESDIRRLAGRDPSASTDAMQSLEEIRGDAQKLHQLEWVEAFRQRITEGVPPLKQRLDALQSQVFAKIDPRQDTDVDDRLVKMEQQLAKDTEKDEQFGERVDKLNDRLKPLLDKQATPWTPANRARIEQELADIEKALADLAPDIFPDPRDGWQWRDWVAAIDQAIQFQKQQLTGVEPPVEKPALDALVTQVQALLEPPWPEDEAGQNRIRNTHNQLDLRLRQMFADLDPRKQWGDDGRQWIQKIAPLITAAREQQIAGQSVTRFDSVKKSYDELVGNMTWSLETRKRVMDRVEELNKQLPPLYNDLYSALNPDPRAKYDLLKLADAVGNEITLARGADAEAAQPLAGSLATAREHISTVLALDFKENQQAVRDGVRDQLAALHKTLVGALRIQGNAPGTELNAMHESWRAQRDHLVTQLGAGEQVGTLLDRVRRLRQFYVELDQALPASLPQEIDGQPVRMPTTVDLNTVAQTIRQRREAAAGNVLAAFGWQQDLMPGVPDDVRTAAVSGYEQWRNDAGRLAIDFRRVERLLDEAYGYREAAPGAAPGQAATVEQIVQRWEGGDVFGAFRDVLSAVIKRVDDVEMIPTLAARDRLVAIARDEQKTGPALLVAAWRRLGQLNDPAWPASLAQLNQEDEIRQRLVGDLLPRIKDADRRAALAGEIDRQGPVRWRTAFTRLPVNQPGEIDEAAAPDLLERFKVALSDLRGEVQFNVALAQLRRVARPDTANDQQIDQQVTLFVERVAKMPDGVAQQQQTQTLVAELEKLRAGGRAANAVVTRAGPATMSKPQWQDVARSADGRTITYEWPGVKHTHRLTFVRVEPAGAGGKPFYLSTREVPLQLFIDVMGFAGDNGQRAVFKRLMPRQESRGPRVWAWTDPEATTEQQLELKVNPTWTLTADEVPQLINKPLYPPGVDPGPPTGNHPMHLISPEGAAWFARLVGCRLPTVDEWQAALREQLAGRARDDYVDAEKPNLRDQRWIQHKQHVDVLARQVVQATGLSPLLKTKWNKDDLSHWNFDDGFLWFAPVGAKAEPFDHLLGNVAEYVVDGHDPLTDLEPGKLPADQAINVLRQRLAKGTVKIIGGSAQWPQSVPIDQPQDVAWQRNDFLGNALPTGFSDVGIRLAYTQPFDPLVLRLRTLLEGRSFLPMPVAEAAEAPSATAAGGGP